jgi:metal-sulfur cluster biosynthetic enzyme
MSTLELKNKVLERLQEVNQPHLLEEILNLIEIETTKEEVFIIPEEHKADLEISLQQLKEGKIVPNDVVNQRVQKWLYR